MLSMVPLTVLSEQAILYGDVNRSNYVDQDDVDDLRQYLAEYSIDIDIQAADVNLDGKVDLLDLLFIEKFVNGLDINLGDLATITFDTDGGTPVKGIMLCKGTALTDLIDEPVTQKDGYIFIGWVKEDGSPFYANEPITKNLKLRAVFEAIDSNIEELPQSFALEDQLPDIAFDIVTSDDYTASEIMNNISLLTKDGSDPVELKVVMVNSKLDEMSYTIDGSSITVPMLDIAIISNDDEDVVSGSFEYPYGGIAVGDTLCIYEEVDPRERDYAEHDYIDDSVAFIKVTGVNGATIYFKGIEDDQVTDVIFIPDTIPFSVDKLPELDNSTIDSTAFDPAAWSFMGRSEDPVFNIGDFVVLYVGNFEDMTEDSPAYFGEITAILGNTLFFKRTTADAIKAANEVFLSKPVKGDDLLENMDVESIEKQVEKQAIDSGFAKEAIDYILDMAEKTDKFRNMTLENMSVTDEKGNQLTKSQIGILKKDDKPEVKVTPKISKTVTIFPMAFAWSWLSKQNFQLTLKKGN